MHPTYVILAIDPGLSGGACIIDIANPDNMECVAFNDSGLQIHDNDLPKVQALIQPHTLAEFGMENPPLFCRGKGAQIASRLGKLRESYGFWRGCFNAHKQHLVAPQTWQKICGLPTTDAEDTQHKRRLAHAAMNFYPQLETLSSAELLAVSDAVLLGRFLYTHLYE